MSNTNDLREKIKKILQDSREEDWAQNFSDPAADEVRTETFNDEYAINELEKLFNVCQHCGRVRKPYDVSDEDYFCQRTRYVPIKLLQSLTLTKEKMC